MIFVEVIRTIQTSWGDGMATVWEWPRLHQGLVESQFYIQVGNLASVSPYTGQQTVYGPNFQRWIAKVVLPVKKGPDWREISGLISRLRGQNELIRMVDYYRMAPGYDVAVDATTALWSDSSYWDDLTGWDFGFMPPYVEVDEAAVRDARTMVLRGFPASISTVLRLGDLGEVRPSGSAADHGHLYEMTSNVNSDASGKTRIYFEPGLRAPVVSGDMFVIRKPTSVFTLATDSEGIIQRSIGNLGSIGLSFVEKLP